MKQDIDDILNTWDFKPGVVQARLVPSSNGRQVIQMRVDLGVLQLETSARPDGERPHGLATYQDYLRQRARRARDHGTPFVLNEVQCREADREFLQYYHRRVCWLALREYGRAVQDADHTLGFMDLVKDHSPSEEYTQAHEQYRGFVLYQRTQAAAAQAVENDQPECAINAVRQGLARIHAFFAEQGVGEQAENDGMVQHLRTIESSLREQYKVARTLQEQLDEAIAAEDYERAARLRDSMRNSSSESS